MDWQFEPILTRFQALVQGLLASLPNVALALVLFLVFWFVAGVARRSVQAVARRAGQPAGIGLVFGRLVSWALLTLGVLVALTVIFPTLTAASLFGALGVSGVAIGFAFKDIFQNLLAGLLILITRPFRIGDQIVSGEHEGTVEDIQVRATLLRTYDNRRSPSVSATETTSRRPSGSSWRRLPGSMTSVRTPPPWCWCGNWRTSVSPWRCGTGSIRPSGVKWWNHRTGCLKL